VIIGSGLLASAFYDEFSGSNDVCIYAAGVSNSSCIDDREYARERLRLAEAVAQAEHMDTFVYFGTCSVADPEARNSLYVLHKLAMEEMVKTHPGYMILRLPQVAGETPNPHTLLNFLYARISRSENFCLWRKAKRNIIDVDDIVPIAKQFISDSAERRIVVNIANVENYPMPEIVHAMENIVGKKAVCDIVERGSEYAIDTSAMVPVLRKAGVEFDKGYLKRVLGKYYAKIA